MNSHDPFILAYERYSRRSAFTQVLIDSGKILFGAFLVLATGLSIPISIFLLLFVRFE